MKVVEREQDMLGGVATDRTNAGDGGKEATEGEEQLSQQLDYPKSYVS